MDISSNALNSYQANQRLSNALNGAEAAALEQPSDTEQSIQDDAISISNRREIFNWLAQEFPQPLNSSANLNRLNQALHDYDVLSLADINQVNQLKLEPTKSNVIQQLENEHEAAKSFTQKKQLNHLIQVYATITAAQQLAA